MVRLCKAPVGASSIHPLARKNGCPPGWCLDLDIANALPKNVTWTYTLSGEVAVALKGRGPVLPEGFKPWSTEASDQEVVTIRTMPWKVRFSKMRVNIHEQAKGE